MRKDLYPRKQHTLNFKIVISIRERVLVYSRVPFLSFGTKGRKSKKLFGEPNSFATVPYKRA